MVLNLISDDPHAVNFNVGSWVLAGILLFFILEKIFDDDKETDEKCKKEEKVDAINEVINCNNFIVIRI